MAVARPFLTVVALALAFAAPAFAGSFQPLAIGTSWIYSNQSGATEPVTSTGPTMFAGHSVIELAHEGTAGNAGLKNYWTVDGDGTVLLWGFDRTLDDFGVSYDPPIAVVREPLTFGQNWISTTTPTVLGTGPGSPISFRFDVLEVAPVSVPAGTYPTSRVAYTNPSDTAAKPDAVSARLASYTITGESRMGVGCPGNEWFWSRDVGQILFCSDDPLQLVAFNPVTAALASSWGRMKAIYR